MGSLGSKLVSLGGEVAASVAKMLAMVMVFCNFKPAGVVRLTVKSLKWFNRFSLPKAASAKPTLSSAKVEPAAAPVMGAEGVAAGVMLNCEIWNTEPSVMERPVPNALTLTSTKPARKDDIPFKLNSL